MQRVGQHIFISENTDEVFDLFFDKLSLFHSFYVGDLLIYSLINVNSDLNLSEEVEISEEFDYEFIKELNSSLKNSLPVMEVEHIYNGDLDSSINLFHVKDSPVQGFYVSEISSDADEPNHTHYQLYKVKSNNLLEINNHWL